LHYSQAVNRKKGTNRSPLENKITLFDECGAIIISNNQYLLSLIKDHQWQQVFITEKESFKNDIKCIIFGHAIFEKMLNPYIGLTCHCLLIHDTELLEHTKNQRMDILDKIIGNIWHNQISNNPTKFDVLPILGIPGLWPDQNQAFYDNNTYFR